MPPSRTLSESPSRLRQSEIAWRDALAMTIRCSSAWGVVGIACVGLDETVFEH
jgi:hypothetical protein